MSASLAQFERPRAGVMNTVFKSGPLFISSKGIGWKSWKKRWFILTRTSLVFFKNDPSALPQRGGEVNLTLGGIDLNNSGSVVVREDKKLLTVLFPDGRDGRTFTLKAESSEDLYEWKTALEQALAQAPSAALVMGHNGIFRNDTAETIDGSFQKWRDKRPVKSMVVGRPILLALEDIDGGPSFLEKALRFLEKFGVKVEGILRQSADVEEVEQRVQEYEQGKTEFASDEDPHVVGDCVKHVLRELPSSPVPASCCTALLEAYRIELKDARISAIRSAISDTFPEPNRRLLQRILKMMHTVAAYSSENRMTSSAVAACMAPLLLRPLLAGECELEDDFDTNVDNSAQLLAAANAANNAHAIITTLVEEYESIFDDKNLHRCSTSPDSQMGNSGSVESSDDDNLDLKNNGYHDAENDDDAEVDEDPERVLSGKSSEISGYAGSDLYDFKVFDVDDSDADSPRENQNSAANPKPPQKFARQSSDQGFSKNNSEIPITEKVCGAGLCEEKPVAKPSVSNASVKRSAFWGRNSARKNLSMESIDSSGEEEFAIQRLEITKNDLRNRIAKEAKGNAILQASLERRKQALHERRLALEQDVSRLQEQLLAERELRAALEVGLSMSSGQISSSRGMDSKTRAELEEIALAEADVARLKQKVAELHHQLNQQRQHHYGPPSDACDRFQHVQGLHTQQKILQQDFDTTLAFCNHERKQRSEESSSGTDWRNVKTQVLSSTSSRQQPSRKQGSELTTLSDSKSSEVSTSISIDELSPVNSAPSNISRITERHPPVASSALVELTTRLDFFKDRRSQLIEQLHSLDPSYGTSSSQSFLYKASPPWAAGPR
ncbi:rho GTPase-activating protein 7-like isoform X2 [Aristolochia californica]|uniref:rho GTPase-activating protein 7-like isoform X2 n=1 Tax=Aristolochia californica TaxID=171875 RepID=UPI0035D8FB7B